MDNCIQSFENIRHFDPRSEPLIKTVSSILTAGVVLRGGRRRRAGGPAHVQRPLVVIVAGVRARRQQRLPAVHRQTTRVIIIYRLMFIRDTTDQ